MSDLATSLENVVGGLLAKYIVGEISLTIELLPPKEAGDS